MKTISLTNGMETLVSDQDYAYLSRWSWGFVRARDKGGYARRTTSGKSRRQWLMHDVVAKRAGKRFKGKIADHRNEKKLDNRRSNLRAATTSQNRGNEGLRRNNTSGYKGVCWSKFANKWVAYIKVNYKRYHLGYFKRKTDAAKAYNKAARKYFGRFAKLNKVKAK